MGISKFGKTGELRTEFVKMGEVEYEVCKNGGKVELVSF